MNSNISPNENAGKILAIFAIIFLAFIIFLSGITNVATSRKNRVNYAKESVDMPERGTIYSRDGRVLSQSFQKYYLAFNGNNINNEKKEFFSELLSIYTGVDKKEILKNVELKKRVVLLENINASLAEDLRILGKEMDKSDIFKIFYVNGKPVRRGLEISAQEIIRIYPYEDLMEPVLGYFSKGKDSGIIGIENTYNEVLAGSNEGIAKAKRDVAGNIILNSNSYRIDRADGSDVVLALNSYLQKDIEGILDKYQQSLESDEIIAVVMDSKSGDIYAMASSKRYNAQSLGSGDVSKMSISAFQYVYEPGSVIKSFIMAALLEEKLIGEYTLIDGHGGKYKLGRATITDTHEQDRFTAEEAIYHSSNIAMAQIAQSLTPYKYKQTIQDFGFEEKTGADISYEHIGKVPSITEFKDPVIKGTVAYGYGLSVNFMQVVKAYNAFNNDGKIIEPKIARKVSLDKERVFNITKNEKQAISQVTAMKMLKMLRKVVTQGTGVSANIDGVFLAGKTGTAMVAKGAGYANIYNSSFVGFANEINGDRKYTIGVLAIKPKKSYFASMAAAPVFKEVVEAMINRGWIKREP